LTAKGRLAHM